MKTWMLMALMAAIFSVLGAGLVVAAFVTGEWALLAGVVFLAVGLILGWFSAATRREQTMDGTAAPASEAGTIPFEQVAERIRARFVGLPYQVDLTGSRILVHADLADTTYLTWAAAHRVKVVRGVEVVAKAPGVAITRDFERDVDISAGIAKLTGTWRVQSGRSWSYQRRVDYGVGTDGSVGKQVDIDFSSTQIQGPVKDVLKETGWYQGPFGSLPAEAKGAVVVAGIAGVGAVVAVVVTGVMALTGR